MQLSNYRIIVTSTGCKMSFSSKEKEIKRVHGYYRISLPMRKKLPKLVFEVDRTTFGVVKGVKFQNTTNWRGVILEEFKHDWDGAPTFDISLQLTRCVSHLSFSLVTLSERTGRSEEKEIKFRIEFPRSDIIAWYPCTFKDNIPDVTDPKMAILPRKLIDTQGNEYGVEELADAIVTRKISPGLIWVRGGTAHGKTLLLAQLKAELSAKNESNTSRIYPVELDFYNIFRKAYLKNGAPLELLEKREVIEEYLDEAFSQLHNEISTVTDEGCKIVVYIDELDIFFEQFSEMKSVPKMIKKILSVSDREENCDFYFVATDFRDFNDREPFFNLSANVIQFELGQISKKDIKELIETIPINEANRNYLVGKIDKMIKSSGGKSLLIMAILSEAIKQMWDGEKENDIDVSWSSLLTGEEVQSAIEYLCNKKCSGDKTDGGNTPLVFRGNIQREHLPFLAYKVPPQSIPIEKQAGLIEVPVIQEENNYERLRKACEELYDAIMGNN